jgi:hypothetical protein
MKLANNSSPLIVSDGLDPNASVMGMTARAALRMTQHLSETIYSNKQLAVVRESLTNSIDEHIKFKIERPVETGIRDNEGQYEFFARDFAEGLDEQMVREVFAMYGESSKTETNDLAGGFGVGTGALVSYNNSAIITSHYKGEKKVYSLVRGANEEGFLVGHCYRIHVEPTDESGIEVCVPIKSEDVSKFSQEIRNFVHFSPHNIVANLEGIDIEPYPVVLEETHEGIDFSLFEGASGHKNNLAILQMGGVKYEYIELPEGFGVKADHTLVINMPVGSMTIPLSREKFHDTPSNQNFKTKIVKFLEQMTERDFAHLKSKPLKDFIDENLGELHANKQVEGSIFKTRIANIYPETSKLIGNLAYVNYGKAVEKNGKPLLILIPNNSATDYWKSKLRDFARVNGESYYFACHAEFRGLNTEGFAEINKYFFPLGIKSLKFPKTKKVKTYAVYNKKYRSGSYNAVGFANCLRVNVFNLPEESDEILLKQWIESEKQKAIAAKNVESLNKLALTVSSPSRYTSWSCGSEELAQHVEDLGLFVTGRGEYSKLVTGLAKEQQEVQAKKDKVKKALKSWITFNPRTINLVTKERNAERLNKFWSAVMSEQTTRSKVFNHIKDSYENYYGNKNKLTRTEFRAIMRLERQ